MKEKKIVPIILITLGLALGSTAAARKVYPYRWVRIGADLRTDQGLEKVRSVVETAAQHGLNGILLSAGLDSMDLQPPDFLRRLQQLKQYCDARHVDIVPCIMSAGYGDEVLQHDKNLAAGLPVKDALYIVSQGEARLAPDPGVEIVNGGFEKHVGNSIDGFTATGGEADSITIDEHVFKEGRASALYRHFDPDAEKPIAVSQDVALLPHRCYRLSCWIRSENLKPSGPFGSGSFQLEVLGGQDRRPLQFENPRLSPTQDWAQVSVAFNSWGYDKVRIVASVGGGGQGQFWLDELRLEEVGLINVLRRPGTPLTVRGEKSGIVYEEGKDFAPVADPVMDFHFNHDGPAIKLLPGSRITDGERLRVSFYHGVFIYNDQVPLCMSEPKLYEIWRKQARLIHEAITPRQYLLSMDELRAGGSCETCKKRGMSMGQILGDTLTRQFNILREANPKAEIFVWSDMLDPNHNADPMAKWYYLTEGTFTDSWKFIPKGMNIVCWYYEKRVPSLRHFSRLGFRTMAGAYYDADDLENPKGWLQALDATPNAEGILYTTWLDKYKLLAPFGDLVSGK